MGRRVSEELQAKIRSDRAEDFLQPKLGADEGGAGAGAGGTAAGNGKRKGVSRKVKSVEPSPKSEGPCATATEVRSPKGIRRVRFYFD